MSRMWLWILYSSISKKLQALAAGYFPFRLIKTSHFAAAVVFFFFQKKNNEQELGSACK